MIPQSFQAFTSAYRMVETVASKTLIKSAGALIRLFSNLLNKSSPAVVLTEATLPGLELPTNPPT